MYKINYKDGTSNESIESIEIDVKDIYMFKEEESLTLFSFLDTALQKELLENKTKIVITNDTPFNIAVIYNIIISDWLVNEDKIDDITNDYIEMMLDRINNLETEKKIDKLANHYYLNKRMKLCKFFLDTIKEYRQNKKNNKLR